MKNIDTSAPLEIGMAAGIDGEEAFEEGCGKASALAVQAVYKGTGAKGGRNEEQVPVGARRSTSTVERVKMERIVQERGSGPRLVGKKGEKSASERWQW